MVHTLFYFLFPVIFFVLVKIQKKVHLKSDKMIVKIWKKASGVNGKVYFVRKGGIYNSPKASKTHKTGFCVWRRFKIRVSNLKMAGPDFLTFKSLCMFQHILLVKGQDKIEYTKNKE